MRKITAVAEDADKIRHEYAPPHAASALKKRPPETGRP
jgi:hypothetical protein